MGKASSPKSLTVFSATVIFKGIIYSSFSSFNNSSASSIDIAKSTPFTFGCTVKGFCVIYASCACLYISSWIFFKLIPSAFLLIIGSSIFIVSDFKLFISLFIFSFNFSLSIIIPSFPLIIIKLLSST